MTVEAEDIEVIPVNDPGTWAAFKWFQLYGFETDFTTTETQTFTTNGSISYSASVQMSESVSGAGSGDVHGSFALEYEEAGQNFSIWIPKSVDLTITPDSGQTGAMSYPQFACVYNAQSTSSSAVMTCTPNGNSVFTQDTYTMEINTLGDAGDGTGGLFAYIRQSSTTPAVGSITATSESPLVASFMFTEFGSSNGSFSGTGSFTGTTTTTNKQSFKFTMPYVTKPDGRWNHVDYDSKYAFYLNAYDGNDKYVIAWIGKQNLVAYYLKLYRINGQEVPSQYINKRTKYIFGMSNDLQLQCLEYSNWDNNYVYLNTLNNNGNVVSGEIYPLYFGRLSQMSDELYRFIYGSDRQIESINAQTAADQQHHDEMMDTSDSSHIATDGDALVNDADEKFGDLFFPLQHAIETANDLSNVQSTGTVRLPAIFADGEYWVLDLTQIEQNIPQAFSFIRSLCQLAVAIFMIKGLYNLFFGNNGGDDNDS